MVQRILNTSVMIKRTIPRTIMIFISRSSDGRLDLGWPGLNSMLLRK